MVLTSFFTESVLHIMFWLNERNWHCFLTSKSQMLKLKKDQEIINYFYLTKSGIFFASG